MIDNERKVELIHASNVLVLHNLYRRGYCDISPETEDIGKSMDMAAGAILCYLEDDKQYELTSDINKFLTTDRKRILAENKRLKALLASHKIKYKGHKK